jgi:hypothetical protein
MDVSAHVGCHWLCLGAVALTLCGAPRALARDRSWTCGKSDRPWVVLAFEGSDWDPKQQAGIREDLAAGLRLRGLLICPPATAHSSPALARVQLDAATMEHVSVAIEVHDALTNKHVWREVDLQDVPPDARGVALAGAAEELLRASWAELALEDATPPVREPPPEVTRAVRLTPNALPQTRQLGVGMSGELHAGGQTLLGPDAWFDLWLGERIGVEIAIGYRRGIDVSASHGTIETQGFVLGGDVLFAVAGSGTPLRLLTRLGVQVASLELNGRPTEDGRGSERRGIGIHARAALVLSLALSRDLGARLELGPGVALRGLAAFDDDEEVTSTSGVLGHAGLGFGASF